MTDTHNNNRESGQVIVLMALLMVILLGALGLAIDGGRMFYLWRNAQNATDAAVLAASYARCTDGDVVNAALDAARLNGFNNNGVNNTVSVYNPPISGEKAGDEDYVQVNINGNLQPYFIQLVYNGPLEVTTEAIGFCIQKFDPSSVPALWAGAKDCQNPLNWTGSEAHFKGGMFSNGDIQIKGSSGGQEPKLTIEGPVDAVGIIEDKDSVVYETPGQPNPYADEQEFPLSYLDISDYAPGGTYAKAAIANGMYHLIVDDTYPDYKNGAWTPNKGSIEGLYYVVGNVDIGTNVTYGPKGATIVATGEIKINPNGFLHYYKEPSGLGGGGIFAYTIWEGDPKKDPCGQNAIVIPAQTSDILGVMVAPNSGVNIQGSHVEMIGAIFAYTIDLSGAYLDFEYDPSLLPPIPPSVQIAQ